ncbi:RraA family protein [Metabacillus idriensis]|uniref:RraA family protein n=1 Tax=Metabacillus idriensis TaxID=324768 RepID=UPI00174D955C|nr:RraA family protein [Metabacillus idriensis]
MTNIGFRILSLKKRPDKSLIKQYGNVVTPHISDNMNRMNAMSSFLRPYHRDGKLVGTAFTIKTRPGDNLMVHKAIDLAEPGDVIVVDAGGDMTNAIFGEIMMRMAKKRGIAGVVVDGAIRDVAAISKDVFPVYAKGVTHRGPYKDGPGEINVPVSIGGIIINPGDIIVGDEDGIAVVPLEEAEDVIRRVRSQQELEENILQSIQEGTINRDWIDETLKQKGCEFLSPQIL